jgi:glycerophosphoryl diester phosphodiesterase
MMSLLLISGLINTAGEGGAVWGFSEKPLIIGHRGAAGLAPENTLAAVARAAELGVDAIELDVLLSADGVPVVHHDFTLKPETTRTADGRWLAEVPSVPIKDLTIEQLKTYDVGRLKPGSRYAGRFPKQQPQDGARIPTLREVIALLKQNAPADLALWIEIKSSPAKPSQAPPVDTLTDRVIQVVRSENIAHRIRILSFDWRALVRIQERAPEIETVYLTSRSKQFKLFHKKRSLLWTAGFDPAEFGGSLPRTIRAAGGRHWAAKHREISAAQVQDAHDAGISVYAWTVDAPADMRHLLAIGVDGIITNRPDLLKSELE